MEKFNIKVRKEEKAVVVSLVGMADMLIVDELDRVFNKIIDQQGGHIVVDFAELDFICSVALSSLIRAHRKCKSIETRFVLASIPLIIQRLLQTTQLDSFFEIFDCPESACMELN